MSAPYHLTNYGDAVYSGSLGVCLAKLGYDDDLTDEERERFEEARNG